MPFSSPAFAALARRRLRRLMAKAINCTGETATPPCNACPSCREITAGNALDLHEIDGASNRGIQEIRDLKDKLRFLPTSSRFKIIIIDEVHMLTTEAFNALLKTLEEPPAHVYFMFATTELHKIPITILSRCQQYELKRVPAAELSAHFHRLAALRGFRDRTGGPGPHRPGGRRLGQGRPQPARPGLFLRGKTDPQRGRHRGPGSGRPPGPQAADHGAA
jgi:hypothetical protein